MILLRDKKALDDIIETYGKDDTFKYIKENFNDSFDEDESDYTEIANQWDNEVRLKELREIIVTSFGPAVKLNNSELRSLYGYNEFAFGDFNYKLKEAGYVCNHRTTDYADIFEYTLKSNPEFKVKVFCNFEGTITDIEVPQELYTVCFKNNYLAESFDEFDDNTEDYTSAAETWDADNGMYYMELRNILKECNIEFDYFKRDYVHEFVRPQGYILENNMVLITMSDYFCKNFNLLLRKLYAAGYTCKVQDGADSQESNLRPKDYFFKKEYVTLRVHTNTWSHNELIVMTMAPAKIFTEEELNNDPWIKKQKLKLSEGFEDSFNDNETDYTEAANKWDEENWLRNNAVVGVMTGKSSWYSLANKNLSEEEQDENIIGVFFIEEGEKGWQNIEVCYPLDLRMSEHNGYDYVGCGESFRKNKNKKLTIRPATREEAMRWRKADGVGKSARRVANTAEKIKKIKWINLNLTGTEYGLSEKRLVVMDDQLYGK